MILKVRMIQYVPLCFILKTIISMVGQNHIGAQPHTVVAPHNRFLNIFQHIISASGWGEAFVSFIHRDEI